MTDPIIPDLTPEERRSVLADGRRRVRNRQRFTIAAGAVALVVLLLPVAFVLRSGHDDSRRVQVGDNGPTTTSAPSTTTAAVTTTFLPTTSTSTAPASTVPPTTAVPEVPTVQTIVPDADTEAALRQAFLDYKGMQSDEIGPDALGTVYVAHVPGVNTWWAAARYTVTEAVTPQHAVNMQDDGREGLFTRWDDGTWRMLAPGGVPCRAWGLIPDDVLEAWGYLPAPEEYCHAVVPPAGAGAVTVDADYLLVPHGWAVTPLWSGGGPGSYATIVDPASRGRIDFMQNGGSNGPGGLHNPDGSANLDSPAAKAMTNCEPTTWVHLDAGTVSFTCPATADGLEVQGLVQIGFSPEGASMLKVTLPPADHTRALAIIDFQNRAHVRRVARPPS